ncbi:MAG: carboxypeptidase regulatory-like domain-containing protein, partial [Planctomycetia bacterium]|nr:carboxypeptidase regulatory-like domain-containing protein [Planctomycetia bacterium]
MKTTLLLRFSILSFLLLTISLSTPAQSGSSQAHISGTLLDSSGAAVADVHTTAQAETNGARQKYETTSTFDGSYALTLPPGHYRITFSHESFVPHE